MTWDIETEISKENLSAVFSEVSKPPCLLGGWAVYLSVNANYEAAVGREYLGSRDIDLGFHFSENESRESIRNSAFGQSLLALEKIGYEQVGFRVVRHYHRETGKGLTIQESKRIPLHDLFELYVDLMVDHAPATVSEVLGITPPDESMLKQVFLEGKFREVDAFGTRITMPDPGTLLATKLRSMPNRTKDHKRWKDLADAYALIWYSGVGTDEIRSRVLELLPREHLEALPSAVTESDYGMVSNSLRTPISKIKSAISDFAASRG